MNEIYQVVSTRLLGQENRMSEIANNLANVNTVGFKRGRTAFEDCLQQMEQANGLSTNASGDAAPGLATNTDYASGALTSTGHPLDMAIDGEGFFRVKDAQGGDYYTRAGNFSMDSTGKLITLNGESVLSASGSELKLSTTGGRPSIATDRTISQDGKAIGKIGVVQFADRQRLQRIGNGLWKAPSDLEPKADTTASVLAGTLEGSNVNMIQEMTDMIQLQRDYEFNQRAIGTFDSLTSKRIEAVTS
jgi:flagellar basal-body rod protein FlgG